MSYIKKTDRQRMKKLLSEGWDARRAVLEEKSRKASEATKKWKAAQDKHEAEFQLLMQARTVREFKELNVPKNQKIKFFL